MSNKPLAGVKIISIEQFGAAPYGSMFLADLGAEVIKIENMRSGGDPARQTGPYYLGDNDSQYFQTWNINKSNLSLDIKSPEGRKLLDTLVAGADAVINNIRGDKAAAALLDYAYFSKIKKSIVCLHITAYGRGNSRSGRPGYDYLMQAESGLMALTGDPDRPPTRIGAPSMIDHVTGLTGITGLLAAIIGARSTGVGCDVDTCLFDVALHQLGYTAIWYLNEQHVPDRKYRSAHFSVTPVQTFPTSDGWIFVMCMTDRFWRVMCEKMLRTDLLEMPEFANQELRLAHSEKLTDILDAAFSTRTSEEWIALYDGVLPVAPVLDLAQALDNPFLQETQMISNVPHPARANFRALANPIKINNQRLSQQTCKPYEAQ